jgi:hypothetical protein
LAGCRALTSRLGGRVNLTVYSTAGVASQCLGESLGMMSRAKA